MGMQKAETVEHNYKKDHLVPDNERTSSSSEQSEIYQQKMTFIYYRVFMIPIATIIINTLASVRQHRTI